MAHERHLLTIPRCCTFIRGKTGVDMIVNVMGSLAIVEKAFFLHYFRFDESQLQPIDAHGPISLLHRNQEPLIANDNIHQLQGADFCFPALFLHSLSYTQSNILEACFHGAKC